MATKTRKAAPKKRAAKPRPPGRPTLKTPALLKEIVARLSRGEPLTVICRDAHMPSDQTVRNWMDADPDLSLAIARAREAGFDQIALDALTIADDDARDWTPVTDPTGAVVGIKVDGEHVTRSKLRVETRLKLLSKWDPKRYGDRLQTVATDPDGNAAPAATVIFELPSNGR